MPKKRKPNLRDFRGSHPDDFDDFDDTNSDIYDDGQKSSSGSAPTDREKKDALGHLMRRHHRRHAIYADGGDFTDLRSGTEAYYLPETNRTVFTGNNQDAGQIHQVEALLQEEGIPFQYAYIFENTRGRSSDYETPLYQTILDEHGALIDSYKHPSKNADILLISETGYEQLERFAR